MKKFKKQLKTGTLKNLRLKDRYSKKKRVIDRS